ncbi:hypothetical protein [Rhodobacter sp. 24-YEA-8]|uniref:hypothetical protein n=1 Tax=Rhodobacter sp. 24-YEA-8 TaxID=1884310 RepID=UPI0008952423|nr:hypothetical protein [Rhodobacter sp. 24-YEA-8]SEB49564.1 hypothetical protein SAMN05519105_0513 [Rhodobacter sp. 24-YEA-8]
MALTRRAFGRTVAGAVSGAMAVPLLPGIAWAEARARGLGMGLLGGRDWSPEQPFLDVMKSARDWIGHQPGQWGGQEHDALAAAGVLDDQGWPRRIPEGLDAIGTVLLTDMPPGARDLAGRYLVTWGGTGDVAVGGLARNPRRDGSRIIFDFTPGPGLVDLRITASDPADPVRDIRVLREDREALMAAGEVFNPDFLARLKGIGLLRFMDWLQTNDSLLITPEDRPRPGDYTWTRRGVPVEIVVELANRLEADPWITLPHMASDALLREMAQIVATGLAPGRMAWVEYSNEVWNWQFSQAAWADQQAKARWGGEGGWLAFYALRAAEAMAIWAEEIADPARLVRVLSTQTGWLGLEEHILAPKQVTDEGRPAPVISFDAWAVTGYFSGALGHEDRLPMIRAWLDESKAAATDHAARLGLEGRSLEAWGEKYGLDEAIERAVAELRDGAVSGRPDDTLAHLIDVVWPYQAEIARKHGLRLVMYEGGTHVTGIGPVADDAEVTAFFTALNYSDGMGVLYEDLLASWAALTDAPFTHYGFVATPGRHGSWGALRHLSDDNPRWRALIRACGTC